MAVDDDMNSDGMQCSDHPFRSTSPGGGICAFCLQDKLGKLVSSSSSSSFLIPPPPSSSPSFRSDYNHNNNNLPSSTSTTTTTTTTISSFSTHHHHNTATMSFSSSLHATSNNGGRNHPHFRNHHHNHNNTHDFSTSLAVGFHNRRARIPFLLTQKKKKKSTAAVSSSSSTATTATTATVQSTSKNNEKMILKRSKSTSTPRSTRYLSTEDFTPRPRGFWSFLHLSHKKDKDKPPTNSTALTAEASAEKSLDPPAAISAVDEAEESPNSSGSNTASFGRKVCRSRSVGCGSRSFSGDFFERISTGFGDCTLRRVESHREGAKQHRHSTSRAAGDVIREKVRCGGLFGGFMITSSSSSTTSSSSSYWAGDGRHTATPATGSLIHGRSRSWGWAFASPMRAFTNTKPTTTTIKDGKTDNDNGNSDSKNSNGTTPNLASIPSLLSVRG